MSTEPDARRRVRSRMIPVTKVTTSECVDSMFMNKVPMNQQVQGPERGLYSQRMLAGSTARINAISRQGLPSIFQTCIRSIWDGMDRSKVFRFTAGSFISVLDD